MSSDNLYDPSWVVALAKQRFPEDERFLAALAACTRVLRYCDCGCGSPYFVDIATEPSGEVSDFGMRISLLREDGSAVAVDLLPDGRVACIEGGS